MSSVDPLTRVFADIAKASKLLLRLAEYADTAQSPHKPLAKEARKLAARLDNY